MATQPLVIRKEPRVGCISFAFACRERTLEPRLALIATLVFSHAWEQFVERRLWLRGRPWTVKFALKSAELCVDLVGVSLVQQEFRLSLPLDERVVIHSRDSVSEADGGESLSIKTTFGVSLDALNASLEPKIRSKRQRGRASNQDYVDDRPKVFIEAVESEPRARWRFEAHEFHWLRGGLFDCVIAEGEVTNRPYAVNATVIVHMNDIVLLDVEGYDFSHLEAVKRIMIWRMLQKHLAEKMKDWACRVEIREYQVDA